MTTEGPSRTLTRVYVLVLIAFAVAVSVWRIQAFTDIDLRADQASTMVWLQNIQAAERLLPRPLPDAGWLKALEADEQSLLNVVLKPIYTGNQQLFLSVTIGLFWAATLFTGAGFAAQVALTILAAGGIIVAVGLFPLALSILPRRQALATGAVAAGLTAACSFLNLFAAFSVHNVAVATMVGALAVIACWIGMGGGRRGLVWVVVASLIAIYSNHANVLYVPTTAVIALLLATEHALAERIRRALRYSAWILIGLVPAILLMLVTKLRGIGFYNKQDFTELWVQIFQDSQGAYLDRLPGRFMEWFEAVDRVYSGAGLLLALFGLVYLARCHGVRVPLVLVVLHFLLAMTLPMTTQYDRTIAYLLPMLALGGGAAFAGAFAGLKPIEGRLPGKAVVLATLAGVVVIAHATRDVPRLVHPDRAYFWGASLKSRGQQRAIVAEIENLLPTGARLVPLNTAIGQQFQAQATRPKGEVLIFKPLDLMTRRATAGALDGYIRDRRLVLPKDAPAYVLVHDQEPIASVMGQVESALCRSALARCSGARLDEVKRWPATWFMLGGPVLYRLADD